MTTALTHVVSGATGLVGRALVLELLARTDADIGCLVRRSSRSEPVGVRLVAGLVEAARAYGCAEQVVTAIHRRCHAIPVDLDQPSADVRMALSSGVEHIWHCAGSLRYHERDRELVHQTNVDGTARLLDLAGDIGASAFHYVSSAYVAGTRVGPIPEQRAELGRARNAYEESKIRAEDLVLSENRFRTTVLRPSVVIGHSRTAAIAGNLSGIYGLGFSLSRHTSRHNGPGGIRMYVDPSATANLVPVDQMSAESVACGFAGRHHEIFHVVSAKTVPVRVLIEEVCRALHLGSVTFVDQASDLRAADLRLAKRMSYYVSYMRGDKVFDRSNTDRVVGPAAALGYVGRPTLADALGWYARTFHSAEALTVGVGA